MKKLEELIDNWCRAANFESHLDTINVMNRMQAACAQELKNIIPALAQAAAEREAASVAAALEEVASIADQEGLLSGAEIRLSITHTQQSVLTKLLAEARLEEADFWTNHGSDALTSTERNRYNAICAEAGKVTR